MPLAPRSRAVRDAAADRGAHDGRALTSPALRDMSADAQPSSSLGVVLRARPVSNGALLPSFEPRGAFRLHSRSVRHKAVLGSLTLRPIRVADALRDPLMPCATPTYGFLMRKLSPATIALLFGAFLIPALPGTASAQTCTCAGAGVRSEVAPPPLPEYDQPPVPAPGYMWTPGYWAWNNYD